ncbi:MnhB domain-containing protein [Methylobacterium nonmethylotrophicum]|uniref:Sodium:proton antiporter n=1 Tax=Methylobacterium nonmethylotrophicum TaxID=1141884 RepID=A0A4Z0NXU4_9HYPH|nr:MnhB domain-containing protein [Methylobacterium nonmethylotrophicum]TGE02306.1 sodium:proton antiporter [Methylobacterium nonmethylotrophicum]
MSVRLRLVLLGLALLALAPAVIHVALALPGFGTPTSPYGQTVNVLLPDLRHVTNMVAAVNFDVRGIDTLGEECMLLCAVTGATVLLRGARGEGEREKAGHVPGRPVTPRADATVLACRIAASLTLLVGISVALHGMTTPGGGFQGGVIAASSLLLLYLGEGYAVWRSLVRGPVLALLEGGGALLYGLAAFVPLTLGRPALQNILPFGTLKDLYSGGLMIVVNAAVALSVTGSFGLLLLEFMEETRVPSDESVPDEEGR